MKKTPDKTSGIQRQTLLALTGLTEPEFRRLKDILPKPDGDQYPSAQTLAALFKHFRAAQRQATIRFDKLETLTGLSDRRHRQLAEEGYLPAPDKGDYQLVPALEGILRFYRTTGDKESITKARKILIDRNIEEKEIEIARLRDQLKPIKFFAEKTLALGEEIKATLNFQLNDRLPALNAGLDALGQRKNNHAVFITVCGRFQEFARQWT